MNQYHRFFKLGAKSHRLCSSSGRPTGRMKKTGAVVQYHSFFVCVFQDSATDFTLYTSENACIYRCACIAGGDMSIVPLYPQALCAASLFDTVAEGISLVFESRHQALFLFWVLAARICVFFGYILGWWLPLVWICFQLEEKLHCLHSALSSSQP